MQVVIMAGGAGSRLRKLSAQAPKALLPHGRGTILGTLLERLADHGMRHAIISIGPPEREGLFRSYFQDQWCGIPIQYRAEEYPLGTSGCLRLIGDLDTDFMVVNCDIVTTLSFSSLFQMHRETAAAATAATGQWAGRLPFGAVQSNADNKITALVEKPLIREEILRGVYALNREAVFSCLPKHAERIDMPDLLSAMIARGHSVRRYFTEDDWLDVGTPEDYDRLTKMLERHE